MKFRIAFIALCFVIFGATDMLGQRGMKHHVDFEQIAKDVDLSETQIEDFKRLKSDMKVKMEKLRSSEEMDWESMHQYKEQWKLEMNAILTVPQQEKLAAIKEQRMKEREEMKEAYMAKYKEKEEEIKAYKDKYIKPMMQEKRMELDKKISKEDKLKIDILRNIASEEQAKRKEAHANGEYKKAHHGKGHHARGPKGKGHHKGPKVNRWEEKHPEGYQMAQDLVAKYSDDIAKIQAELMEDKKLWESEIEAIKSDGKSANCDTKSCDPKDCKPENCDPAQCCPEKLEGKRWRGQKGKHGKRAHHLSDDKLSFEKQIRFLLIDTEETQERELNATDFPEFSAYPNPASSSQVINLNLTESQRVNVTIIDMSGKELMEVHNGKMDKGENRMDVDLTSLPNNIYFYRVSTKTGSKLIQFVVTRA